MISRILRRLAISLPLLMTVSFLTFVLISLTPGDAAYTVLGARATPDQLDQLRSEMGLDKPLLEQYFTWLQHAVHGDLGNSLVTGQPVTEGISQRLVPTISLTLAAILVVGLIGVWIGVWSAVRGGWAARIVDAITFGGIAVPNFVLALVLVPIFAISLKLLPPSGYVSFSQSPSDWLRALVLPVAALAVGSVGIVAKQTRSAFEDVLTRDFIVVLLANGYRRRSIIYRHALKAAAVPIISILGVVFVGLLSGTVLIESVFAVPGLGGLAVQASAQSDLPLLVGVTVTFTLFVVVVNLVVDICYALVNPKVGLR